MKTRNGFVSNSSSSSFVVAFPKKPKNAKDVLEYMFNGKEGGIGLEYYDDGLSYNQVVNAVFEDIKSSSAKKADLKMIAEVLMSRYYYHTNIGGCRSYSTGGSFDELGGYWYNKLGRYFGFDQKAMNDLRDCYIDEETKDREFRDLENKIMSKFKKKQPKYAYKGGIDNYTKLPYTDEQIRKREEYDKALEDFKNTNPEYVAYNKERRNSTNDKWSKQEKLRNKVATKDAQNFLDDNKGKFIFVISYSDSDGEKGGLMEHSNIFRNVPHITISNH
jgi:hypothetical protein